MFNLINDACSKLLVKDKDLFEVQINERTLTHRLALYLEEFLPEEYKGQNYKVDCEYNRLWDDPKRIHIPCEYQVNWRTDDLNWKTVYPDVIIHKRWELWRKNNLAVIEAKKSSNTDWRDKDICKLRSYKIDEKYWYQFAFFIDFMVWADPRYEISIINESGTLEKIKH